jgi:4-alpha-glucanotransferase
MTETGASALHVLAERVGVALEYISAWGETQAIADDTLRAVLSAMDLPAGTDAEAERSLAQLDARAWGRTLEPVTVIEAGTPPAVTLRLRRRVDHHPGEWRVRFEDEREVRGSIMAGALAVLDGREGCVRYLLELP